jgi:proline iminopeptidase
MELSMGQRQAVTKKLATMDPAFMEMMAGRLPRGNYLCCPKGSHCALYDDQKTYFTGLIAFLQGLPERSN